MNNETIVAALEAFTRWGDDDKRKVIRQLSDHAIQNALWWLTQTKHGKRFMRENAVEKPPVVSPREWTREEANHRH